MSFSASISRRDDAGSTLASAGTEVSGPAGTRVRPSHSCAMLRYALMRWTRSSAGCANPVAATPAHAASTTRKKRRLPTLPRSVVAIGPRIRNACERNDQFVIPRVGDGMVLGRVLARVIGKKPHLAEALIVRGITGREVVRSPIEHELRRLVLARHPEPNAAARELVADPRSGRDSELERHPLVGYVAVAVPARRKVRRSRHRIETERLRSAVLQLEIRRRPW